MHIVASRTLASGNRGMRYRLAEFLFIVASPAVPCPHVKEKLARLGLIRMRFGVTRHTTAGLYYRMQILP
jgi:hypothetical protein